MISNGITPVTKVCRDHFEPECFKIEGGRYTRKPGKIPTIFIRNRDIVEKTVKQTEQDAGLLEYVYSIFNT